MKKIFILFAVLSTLCMQAQVSVNWFNYPAGVSIAADDSDNVYTAYWDSNPAGDITLTKRNSAGVILWDAFYDNTDMTRHEVATYVATDYAGNCIVSGTIRSGTSSPVNAASVLMKFNAAGTLVWRVVYESSFDGSSTMKCLVDSNNNIYVLGIGTGSSGQVTKVKKFNPSGVTVWDYYDAGNGAPVTFKFTPDHHLVLVHRGVTGNLNAYTKIDLNGNLLWTSNTISSSTVGDAAGDAFGNTYLINGGYPSGVLTKLSPAGTVIWTKSNMINGNKIEVGKDNQPVVGGYTSAGYGVVFIKYDSSGNVLWQNLDADGPSLALLAITPMKLDKQDAAYLAGGTMSSMGLCKVNSNGTSAWAITTASGYAANFVFGKDSCVYLVGGTTAAICQAVVSGISDNPIDQKGQRISIYPNPTSGILYLKNVTDLNEAHTLDIFDISGKRLIHQLLVGNAVDIASLTSGFYVLRIHHRGSNETVHFIVE